MFKKVTRYIASQMDPDGGLAPVEKSGEEHRFRPLCLLTQKRKQNTSFRSDPYYECTQFRLDSVLLPGKGGKSTESLLPSGDDSSQFGLTKATIDEVKVDLSIGVKDASVELKGGGSLSQAFSIKLQKKAISMDLLEAVRKNRKIDMNHSFIQQLLRTGADLFLVYEILEASEAAIYEEDTKEEWSFFAWIYAKFFGEASRKQIEKAVIPKGCTLAFRAIQMNISKGEWELSYFKEDPVTGYQLSYFPRPKLDTVDREVKQYCGIFSELPSDLRVMFLNTITAVMRDRNLFQELSQKMEGVLEKTDGYELKTESPDLKDLLSTLENSPRDRCLQLAEGITYTLDALAELLDNQLALLLESLERKIVSQQLQLVGKLLEHELEDKNESFRVDASLLSFPQQEDQSLTMALVELSRVKLQEDGSAEPMERPFEVVAALYVALYALSLLSGDLVLSRESLPKLLGNLCP
ncbi:gasdermin-A isoform X3 [Manacus candei]|uniref:gasdermin-A isoform X3 n=1 Tax=Manacus candei TaxID=415023 RepID=UPI00222600B5|nr:gasdermin-A isoform X3 [Manacus candei]